MKTKAESGYIIESVILAVIILLTLPLRTVQYYSVIEPGSGFYTKMSATVILFYILIAAACLFFVCSSFAKRKKYTLDSSAKKRPVYGFFCALCGIAAGISAYREYSLKDVDTSKYTVSSTVMQSASSGLLALQMSFAVLSAVFFILLAISCFMGRNLSDYKLFSLAPVLWNVFRLVVRFTRTISYIRVSDLLLEMLMISAFCLFLMAFAQSNSQINAKGIEWKIPALGFTAALLGLICFVPRVILTVTGHADMMYALSRADIADLALALFAIATVTTRMVAVSGSVITAGEPESETAE